MWEEDRSAWFLPCWVEIDASEASEQVPGRTKWWIEVPDSYPAGEIRFLPDHREGLRGTHPHQMYNDGPVGKDPWQQGNLCLTTPLGTLRMPGTGAEPLDAESRLAWNVERAREWLRLAAGDQLRPAGDPFELPDFQGGPGLLAFQETEERFQQWKSVEQRYGFARLLHLEGERGARFLVDFETKDGDSVQGSLDWGPWVRERAKGCLGVWIRLENVPIVPPWQAPMMWPELVRIARAEGIDLSKVLPLLFDKRLPRSGAAFSVRPRYSFVIGFPVPRQIGGPNVRMHWVSFDLPQLTERKDFAYGFRPNKRGWFAKDVGRIRELKPIPWRKSQSWTDEDLTGRGRLSRELREASVLLLGAGALGSSVAELLIRGGVRHLTVFDGDRVEIGNMVRHTLSIQDLGRNKAEALADRLHALSPHVRVQAVVTQFSTTAGEAEEAFHEADLILDCTASESALMALERFKGKRIRTFASLSLGFRGCRLYFFLHRGTSFDRSAFQASVGPPLDEEWQGVDAADLPTEGIGCWHPLLPATAADVSLLAAVAVQHLSRADWTSPDLVSGELTIFEQTGDGSGYTGIRRVAGEAAA